MDQGIEAYDRGQLYLDFAKLPDSQYPLETDEEGTMQQDSRYDSDHSKCDFEDKLEALSGSGAADEAETASEAASEPVLRLAGDTSDSEGWAPQPLPVISSGLQLYILETVKELRSQERISLERLFGSHMEQLKVRNSSASCMSGRFLCSCMMCSADCARVQSPSQDPSP